MSARVQSSVEASRRSDGNVYVPCSASTPRARSRQRRLYVFKPDRTGQAGHHRDSIPHMPGSLQSGQQFLHPRLRAESLKVARTPAVSVFWPDR